MKRLKSTLKGFLLPGWFMLEFPFKRMPTESRVVVSTSVAMVMAAGM